MQTIPSPCDSSTSIVQRPVVRQQPLHTGRRDLSPTLFDPSFCLNPEPDPPAEETRLAMIARSPGVRAQFVLDLTIFTDQLNQGVASIEAMMHRAGQISAPGGEIILGEGGTGKTFLINRMLKRFPPHHSRLVSFVPVVTIKLEETPMTEKFKVSILKALGHASATKLLSSSERADDVISALAACGARCLLIDEGHHLQLTSGARRNKDRLAGPLGEYLIGLYEKIGLAFIYFGTPSLGDLFAYDKQLSTRWPGRISLAPYALDEHWLALLDSLDDALPMQAKAGLAEPTVAAKIYEFTLGYFRCLKSFLSEAVRQAAIDHADRLENRHLQLAYYLLGFPPPNPFGEYWL